MDHNAYVFFGKSGSGKGTQVELLVQLLKDQGKKVLTVGMGEKMRALSKSETYTGGRVKEVVEHGGLLPAFIPAWAWAEDLINNSTGTEDFVLEGVSRRPEEAPVLDSALSFYHFKHRFIIHMNVSDAWAYDRLHGRSRSDDTDEDIKKRLAWFETDVVPVLDYFKSHPGYTFLDINGERPIPEIHQDIIARTKDASNL